MKVRKLLSPLYAISKLRLAWIGMRLAHFGGRGFMSLSAKITGVRFISIGVGPVILRHAWVESVTHRSDETVGLLSGTIIIGDRLHMAQRSSIVSAFSITIGNEVTLGPGAIIIDNNHGIRYLDSGVMKQPLTGAPIIIGDFVWLGANVCVLPGVTIGRGAVVGAGSVVTHDVDEFSIVAGVPARVIGNRKSVSLNHISL